MTTAPRLTVLILASLAALSACRSNPATDAGPSSGASANGMARPTAMPATDAFFRNLSTLCGHAYAGRVIVDRPTPAGLSPFEGKALVMHVRECTPDTVRIPLMVGDDRSRTWIVTRTATGLRLKHDHRRQDGTEDPLTMYGGDTVKAGSAKRQVFPADEQTKALFVSEQRNVSVTNVWAMEVEPGERFIYELSRPGRMFRVEFDLSEPVPAPPPPWGWRQLENGTP
ncbi:hypothetical protein [Lysobacter panacisoli]|uniref:Lipoprotein n=1 Tax=Lysobacter panacisoli TaxID=1255263 RepID=A0ABP9LNA9_9GAMM|nr:hypothetical protein [Lysobacter panacisoli]